MWKDKSDALAWLSGLRLPSVVVPRFVTVSADAWLGGRAACLARARALGARLAVRSDRAGEGEAQAGAWLSLLDVEAGALAGAIERVFASYGEPRAHDRVLVQRQVRGARLAGVASSRALPDGAPMRVASIVAATSNAGVTAAAAPAWTAYDSGTAPPSGRFAALRRVLAGTLDALVRAAGREVEIEWLWRGGRLHIVQVRALTLPMVAGTALQLPRRRAQRVVARAVDAEGVLAWMPDWNPAELLGEHPRPLARALFGALIADRTWSQARAAMGYAAVAGSLLQPVAGRPYVRVERSLASLLPATLPPAQRAGIVARQLRHLRAHPSLHDRIEFELACSAFEFGTDWTRRAGPWSPRLLCDWRAALLAQAPQLYALAPLRAHAECARFALAGERHWPRTHTPRAWLRALARLRLDWALPFAQSARRCFAFEALARSAQRRGAVSADELAQWRGAAAVPAGRRDWRSALRPGTFEIASECLRDHAAWPAAVAADAARRPALRAGTRAALDALCAEHGLALDAATLQAGFMLAHRARDWGKAVLSVELSAGLDALAALGAAQGFSAGDLGWLELANLRAPDGARWRARIEAARARHAQDALLRMPALVDARTRLDAVLVPPGRPHYLGRGRVLAPVRWIGLDTRPAQVEPGAILLLERCEPGFDWVFACRPRALVAAFGGPNAHVALRAHELRLPALLGVGRELLQRMASLRWLEIDFDAGCWRAQANAGRRQA